MKSPKGLSILIISLFLFACVEPTSTSGVDSTQDEVDRVYADTVVMVNDTIDSLSNSNERPKMGWKTEDRSYPYFRKVPLDTIFIGPNRAIKDPSLFFTGHHENLFIWIEEGEYIMHSGIWVEGKNLIVRGQGNVSLLCDQLYENVMWVSGENVVIDNLHMKHLMRGESEGQNCSGRVVGFDNASNITIINCDLNGCGLAGLHDNLGNSKIHIVHNHIHNNSLGAYTDINGGVWQTEIPDHEVFQFEANLIENNGFDRVLEDELYQEDE